MALTLDLMGKKKSTPPPSDRHKRKSFQLRLHPLLRQQLEVLAEMNASDMTAEVSIAIRERLERLSLWPPPRPIDEG